STSPWAWSWSPGAGACQARQPGRSPCGSGGKSSRLLDIVRAGGPRRLGGDFALDRGRGAVRRGQVETVGLARLVAGQQFVDAARLGLRRQVEQGVARRRGPRHTPPTP